MPTSAPSPNAVLFNLTGCLVDFGAHTAGQLSRDEGTSSCPPDYLHTVIGEDSTLCEPTPGALELLQQLKQQSIPCAWLDSLPEPICEALSRRLPPEVPGFTQLSGRPHPAPDRIWHALMALNTTTLQGCVLVSGDPLMLQAALNAGLWTVGLAVCGPLCGHAQADWRSLPKAECDRLRSAATLTLYRLGVHSVIDLLSELPACLNDIGQRRLKGEKP